MSGADVLAQVREIDAEKLRLLADWIDVIDAQRGSDGDEAQRDLRKWADALAALDGCVLLTREEADELAEAMDWARGGNYDYLDAAVAFLTSTKEDA